MPGSIFISHATKDDTFVKALRLALEAQGSSVWIDSRNLRGGDKLAPEIQKAISEADYVIVVLSPNTVNSPWVRREIKLSRQIELQRQDDFRVVPVLLPGIEPSSLDLWFDEEPVGVPVSLEPGALEDQLYQLLVALGQYLPIDQETVKPLEATPVAELLLRLTDPIMVSIEAGTRRARAQAMLVYQPADYPQARLVESRRFYLTAPLGPIEAEELRWYLEHYYIWPVGVFKQRAKRIEAQLPKWGQDLYQEALGSESAKHVMAAWQGSGNAGQRRFSVLVDSQLPEGSEEEAEKTALEAANELLSLPWELLHDEQNYLFRGQQPVRVRRRLPNRHPKSPAVAELPIRILLVSPRPEDENTGYIDHRISARPLVTAVEKLGALAELTVLQPPTFPALAEALEQAKQDQKPFDVVHFDGHGVFDREHGLGGLCFEDMRDLDQLEGRSMKLIHAEALAEMLSAYSIPLVFLEACQSARSTEDPTASVAGKLLEYGVTSVVAMSHSVLVETARRFVEAFYQPLATGVRVG